MPLACDPSNRPNEPCIRKAPRAAGEGLDELSGRMGVPVPNAPGHPRQLSRDPGSPSYPGRAPAGQARGAPSPRTAHTDTAPGGPRSPFAAPRSPLPADPSGAPLLHTAQGRAGGRPAHGRHTWGRCGGEPRAARPPPAARAALTLYFMAAPPPHPARSARPAARRRTASRAHLHSAAHFCLGRARLAWPRPRSHSARARAGPAPAAGGGAGWRPRGRGFGTGRRLRPLSSAHGQGERETPAGRGLAALLPGTPPVPLQSCSPRLFPGGKGPTGTGRQRLNRSQQCPVAREAKGILAWIGASVASRSRAVIPCIGHW